MRPPLPTPRPSGEPESLQIDSCKPQRRALQEGRLELHALTKGHYPGKRMNPNTLPGLKSVGFWNYRGPQDWGLEPHHNEGLEIVFLETGHVAFEVDGRQHPLHAGHLTLTRPWQLHKLGDPHIGQGRLYWLILDVGARQPGHEWSWPEWVVLARRDLTELTRELRRGGQAVWLASPVVAEVFREIAGCILRWGEPHMSSRLGVAINRLLVEFCDLLARQPQRPLPQTNSRRHSVESFLDGLAREPASSAKPWVLKSMAQHCGMGITALAGYCRQAVNCGPMAYLNQCRLEHAAQALRQSPGRSITDIAISTGFNSSQYFATRFRERYQMTPMEYRAGKSQARER